MISHFILDLRRWESNSACQHDSLSCSSSSEAQLRQHLEVRSEGSVPRAFSTSTRRDSCWLDSEAHCESDVNCPECIIMEVNRGIKRDAL